MAKLITDVRHAVRAFLKTPGFTLAAVTALALGIGANTAIFSIVNAVLLKPVAFPEPDRMVIFQTASAQGAFSGASPAKFRHWRDQSDIVEDVAAYRSNIINLTGAGLPEQLRAQQVSAEFFKLFGVPIQSGRPFTAEEDRPDQPNVVLVSHALWVRRFTRIRPSLAGPSNSAAVHTRSSALSAQPSTSASSDRNPSSSSRSRSTRTRQTRATTSRPRAG